MTPTEKMRRAAPAVLRVGMALLFIWFGYSQLTNTAMWVRLIPSWVTDLGPSAVTMVRFNGAFEVVFGLCLLFGFFFRVVSLLLALHMIHIALTLWASGFSPVVARDLGLSFAAVALFLLGPHRFSVDNWLCTRYEQKGVQS